MKPEERVVFGTSVESMAQALGKPVPAQHHAALRAIGIDVTKPMLAAYPYATYLKLVDYVGKALHPNLVPDERDYLLGRAFIENYASTVLGKAVMTMAKVMGPKRATHRMTRSIRAVNNYTETGTTDVAPNAVEIWCDPVARPHYHRGILQAGGEAMDANKYRVELVSHVGERAVYRISWAD